MVADTRPAQDFIAIAAHELRAPLAGLRAHAEVARHATTPRQLAEALDAVMQGVDRAAHLLEQLLDTARIDSLVQEPSLARASFATVALHDVLRLVLGDIGVDLASRGASVDAELGATTVHGVAFGIEMLLRNLLRNAVLHTPAGGHVHVRSAPGEQGGVVLEVDDAGPGIPPALRARVFEPFYRGDGETAKGCGLGLSIVQAVARVHVARIELLDAPAGGLRVRIEFPPPPQAV